MTGCPRRPALLVLRERIELSTSPLPRKMLDSYILIDDSMLDAGEFGGGLRRCARLADSQLVRPYLIFSQTRVRTLILPVKASGDGAVASIRRSPSNL